MRPGSESDGPTQDTGTLIVGSCQASRYASQALEFLRELCSFSIQIVSMYDRVIPGMIILRYLNAPSWKSISTVIIQQE